MKTMPDIFRARLPEELEITKVKERASPERTVRNQSPHQHLVGQSFFRDNCRMCCIAAHEDAILILQYGGDGQSANYVVCHHPELDHGTLIWGAGGITRTAAAAIPCPTPLQTPWNGCWALRCWNSTMIP